MNDNLTVRFEPDHLKHLILQKHERDTLDISHLLLIANSLTAEVRSCFYKERLLGLGGYFPLWPGVIELFIIPSVYLPKYPKVSCRVIQWGLDILKSNPTLHRIQTTTVDDPIRNRFVASLGFRYEGTFRQYTKHQESYRMWALVRGNINGAVDWS